MSRALYPALSLLLLLPCPASSQLFENVPVLGEAERALRDGGDKAKEVLVPEPLKPLVRKLDEGVDHVGREGAKLGGKVVMELEKGSAEYQRRVDEAARIITEAEMRVLPGELREGVDHLSDEAKKELAKNPQAGSALFWMLKTSNPLLAAQIDALFERHCDEAGTAEALRSAPNRDLDDAGRSMAWITTPTKRSGLMGWVETGCRAVGEGVAVYGARRSTDQFWTVDIRVTSLRIGAASPPGGERYIRLEIQPGGRAHALCDRAALPPGTRLWFEGPVRKDTDWANPFLEVHPYDGLQIIPPQGSLASVASRSGSSSARTGVVVLDNAALGAPAARKLSGGFRSR